MTAYAGFDRSEYPGAAVMKWLRDNTNLCWAGFYLAPSPSHQDPSWMSAAENADAGLEGWGLAPIYVGQQTIGPGSHVVTAAQGSIDGASACVLMTKAGFDAGSTVYLDQEQGGPEPSAMRAYTNAWAAAVKAGGFRPGVYMSFQEAATVHADLPDAPLWVYHVQTTAPHSVSGMQFPTPDPSTSGYAGASIWQRDDEARIVCPVAAGGILACDLDSANSEDPSAAIS